MSSSFRTPRWIRAAALTLIGAAPAAAADEAPQLAIEPAGPVEVVASVGGAAPADVLLGVGQASPTASLGLPWIALQQPAVSWLAIDPPFGVVPAGAPAQPLALRFSPNGLASGLYSTVLSFHNAFDPSDVVHVTVRLTLNEAPAGLSVKGSKSVLVGAAPGGAVPEPVVHLVGNDGPQGSELAWTAEVSPGATWLRVEPSYGALPPGNQVATQTRFDTAGLAPGLYHATVTWRNVDDPTETESVGLTLDLDLPHPDLCMTLADTQPIAANYTQGSPSPAPILREVTNCFLGDAQASGPWPFQLAWGVSMDPPAPWLSVNPGAGLINPGQSEALQIQLHPENLTEGTHATMVRVYNLVDSEDFEEFPVAVMVGLPQSDLCLDNTNPVEATYVIGGPGPIGPFKTVTNCGEVGSVMLWAASPSPGVPWLFTSPGNGFLESGESVGTQLIFNPVGLAPGDYNANLRFSNRGFPADFETVAVTLHVVEPIPDLCLDSTATMVVNWINGAPAPASQSRTVTNCGDALSELGFAVNVQPNVAWLNLVPTNGSLPAAASQSVSFDFSPLGLPPGSHQTVVRFQNVEDPEDFEDVQVQLNVSLPPANLSILAGEAFHHVYDIGGPAVPADAVSVHNVGPIGSLLNWDFVTIPPAPWLDVHPVAGQLASGDSEPTSVLYNPAGLAPGTYVTTLRYQNLDNAGDFEDVPVTLEVRLPDPDLCVDSAAIVNRTFIIGGADPAPEIRNASNCGHPLSSLPMVAMTVPNVTWLHVAPPSQSLAGPGNPGDSTPLTISFTPAGLAPGMHQATVKVLDVSDPSDSVEIPVVLMVEEPDADLTLDSTAPVEVTYDIGGPVPANIVRTVGNGGQPGSTLDWTVGTSPPAPWLFIAPGGGSLASGAGTPVTAQFNVAALPEGTYQTAIRFQNADVGGDFEEVAVTLHVHLPKPDLCLDDASPVVAAFDVAGPVPPPVMRNVTNCGDPLSELHYAVIHLPNVSWLQVTNPFGALGEGKGKQLTFSFFPEGLEPGIHETTVKVQNVGDASDFVQFDVTLTVSMAPADLCLDSSAPIDVLYEIGGEVPADQFIGVMNCGDAGSVLHWSVELLEPAPWLFFTPPFGILESGDSEPVKLAWNLLGLEPGVYDALLRFQNGEDIGDKVDVAVHLEVKLPLSDLCIDKGLTDLVVMHTIGNPPPDDFTVHVENCGHELSTLNWGVSADPPVAWLAIGPTAGVIPPGDPAVDVVLSFNPDGLVDGAYETTLRFLNLDDPLDFVDLPVTLQIGNIVFKPGDRLIGSIDGFDEAHELDFDGIKGMRLKLNAKSVEGTLKFQLTVIDPQEEVVDSVKIKNAPKLTKKSIKLTKTGRHKLRIEPLQGTEGPVDIATSRKLPKKAMQYKKVAGPGADGLVPAPLLALPEATLQLLRAKPKGFTDPLSIGLITPAGGVFDVTGFSTTKADGTVLVEQVPLGDLGKWLFQIGGVPTAKKAKVLVKVLQPPKGTATIVLP